MDQNGSKEILKPWGMAVRSVDWQREDIFRLIDLYHQHACLWDHDHPDRRNKMCKDQAWNQISCELEVERAEIERKIKSLCTQFFREYKKKIKAESVAGCDEAFLSKWFAFEPLCFLSKRLKHRSVVSHFEADEFDTVASEGDDTFADFFNHSNHFFDHSTPQLHQQLHQMKQENLEQHIQEQHIQQHHIQQHHIQQHHIQQHHIQQQTQKCSSISEGGLSVMRACAKRKLLEESSSQHCAKPRGHSNSMSLSQDSYNGSTINENGDTPDSYDVNSNTTNIKKKKANNTVEISNKAHSKSRFHIKDEYDTYGEYVAFKLRKISSPLARCRLQKNISEVLYASEMEAYMSGGVTEGGDGVKEMDGGDSNGDDLEDNIYNTKNEYISLKQHSNNSLKTAVTNSNHGPSNHATNGPSNHVNNGASYLNDNSPLSVHNSQRSPNFLKEE